MLDPQCVVLVCLAALVGLLAGYGVARWQDRVRLTSAHKSADEIIVQAKAQAENLRKEAELKAKDELFQKRDELNREFEQERNKQHEQERRLEKREDVLEQKHQSLVKKERILESAQR